MGATGWPHRGELQFKCFLGVPRKILSLRGFFCVCTLAYSLGRFWESFHAHLPAFWFALSAMDSGCAHRVGPGGAGRAGRRQEDTSSQKGGGKQPGQTCPLQVRAQDGRQAQERSHQGSAPRQDGGAGGRRACGAVRGPEDGFACLVGSAGPGLQCGAGGRSGYARGAAQQERRGGQTRAAVLRRTTSIPRSTAARVCPSVPRSRAASCCTWR